MGKEICGDWLPFGKLQEHHPTSIEINWTFSVKFIHCILTHFFLVLSNITLVILPLSIFSGFNPEVAHFCLKMIIWLDTTLLFSARK